MSLKATFVRLVPALGFVMLKVKDVVPFRAMLAAPKVLVIAGAVARSTFTLALEVFPVPPSFEVTCTLLFFVPVVVPCTLTRYRARRRGSQRSGRTGNRTRTGYPL